jgi:hypothetical protein
MINYVETNAARLRRPRCEMLADSVAIGGPERDRGLYIT